MAQTERYDWRYSEDADGTVHRDAHEPVSNERLLTVDQAAARLAIGRSKLYLLLAACELPVVRIGRAVRIPSSAVDQFIAAKLRET
jgi:excisionase family DNA binding protein